MIAIYYFSGTGNTRYIARRLAAALVSRGFDCAPPRSIEDVTAEEAGRQIACCQAVLFGYPVYGSYTCELMVDFLRNVHVPAQVQVGFFCTQLVFSGDGARIGHKLLGSEARTSWGLHVNMPNNLNCGSFGFLPITNDPKKIRRKYLEKAERQVEKLALCIQQNKSWRTGFSLLSRLLGLMQRPGYRRVYIRSWHAAMQVDQARCIQCGLCLQQCPSGNVSFKDGFFQMDRQCVLCLRCYNFCPVQAVLFLGKSHQAGKETYQGLPDPG